MSLSDYVLLVDNTGTMRYGGRAESTLAGLEAFIGQMVPGDRVSVFSYGERVQPVLADYPVLISGGESKRWVVEQLRFSFDEDRTDITAGLERVWNERDRLFPRHGDSPGGRSSSWAAVVLLTDGKLIPVYDDYSHYDAVYVQSRKKLASLSEQLGRLGIPVHVIAVGKREKVWADETVRIADASRGTFHLVEDATELPDIYAGLADSSRPEDISPDTASCDSGVDLFDSASAAGGPETRDRKPYTLSASWLQYVPAGLFERYAGILAIFVGAVAIGVDRQKRWALAFTRKMGRPELRVRGYLRPVDPPGVFSARPIVGLENPGLPSVKVGLDTPYIDHVSETLIEFVGTSDGTPPTLVVEKGRVLVEGEVVEDKRKLRDGDIIEIEKVCYRYLRGSRR